MSSKYGIHLLGMSTTSLAIVWTSSRTILVARQHMDELILDLASLYHEERNEIME